MVNLLSYHDTVYLSKVHLIVQQHPPLPTALIVLWRANSHWPQLASQHSGWQAFSSLSTSPSLGDYLETDSLMVTQPGSRPSFIFHTHMASSALSKPL